MIDLNELYKKINIHSFLNLKTDNIIYSDGVNKHDIIQFKREVTMDQLEDNRKIFLDYNKCCVCVNGMDGVVIIFFFIDVPLNEYIKIVYSKSSERIVDFEREPFKKDYSKIV